MRSSSQLDGGGHYRQEIRGDRASVLISGGKLFSTRAFANHFAVTGTVDELRIYNRALTADEVALLFRDS